MNENKPATSETAAPKLLRRKLSDTRTAINHKFYIAGHEGYLTVGLFEDGSPGEVFITMAKEGSTIGGLLDVIASQISLELQYGIPVEVVVKMLVGHRFQPSGVTRNPDIRYAASIAHYIGRWLGIQFVPGYKEANSFGAGNRKVGVILPDLAQGEGPGIDPEPPDGRTDSDGGSRPKCLTCPHCGHITVCEGTGFKCLNCEEWLDVRRYLL